MASAAVIMMAAGSYAAGAFPNPMMQMNNGKMIPQVA